MTRMNGRKMGAIRVLQKAISFFLIVAQYSTPICSSSEMDQTLESMDQTLESITRSSSHSGIYRSGLKEPGMEIGSDTFDPDRIVVSVDDFGAVGDGYTDDTEAVTFESNNDLLVRNLNVKNSQQIHITFKNCFGVEASNLVVTAPEHSPNTDGIHITASTFVVVQNSVIGTGDDCVSIVSDSFDIVIQNVNCGPGHGISIGSLGKGKSEARVAGVLVDRVFLHDTTNGLRIKTWQVQDRTQIEYCTDFCSYLQAEMISTWES